MASSLQPGDSRKTQVKRAVKSGYDRFKRAINPSSHFTAQNPIIATTSTTTPSPSAGPASSVPSVPNVQPNATGTSLATSQTIVTNSHGQLTGSSAVGLGQAPTIPVVGSRLPTTTKLRDAASSGLESALRVLERSVEAIPVLKPVVREFLGCLDIIQAAKDNAEDYDEITLELTTTADDLGRFLGEFNLGDPSGSVSRIALSIEAEVTQIKQLRDRSKGRRVIKSNQDKDDLIKRYRRVERLFRQLQRNITLLTWDNTSRQYAMALLRGMSPVDDARYNSIYSTTIKRRGCTEQTREEIQAGLHHWVQDSKSARIYWMNGMAGTGKTTIAYSLCEWLTTNQLLGASFFCSRMSPSCRNFNLIVPTIAYRLALYSPQFQYALCKILEEDPEASKLNVAQQFERLIRDPVLGVKNTMPEGVVIVIDALDECEDEYGVRLILQALLRHGTDLPLKFFVTSRPEPAIRERMLSQGECAPTVLHLHDIEQSLVEKDIKKYLLEALEPLSPFPSDEQIEQLAKLAGKLFIYAATAVRYILPGRGATNSVARLNAMLAADLHSRENEGWTKRYKQLDELYSAILTAAFDNEGTEDNEINCLRLVLWTIVCAKERMDVSTLASFLSLAEHEVSSVIEPLRSVVDVSQPNGLVAVLHSSFPDYILDRSRSGDFYCSRSSHNELLARYCFNAMKKQLQFNICKLESSYVFDRDVLNLEQRIKVNILPTLFYACQYWGDHLLLGATSAGLCDELAQFLAHRLLFWMEVLNLKKCIAKGIMILAQVGRWLSVANALTDLQKRVADARDFVTRFSADACSHSTPHIYISAIPFCARSSSVYANYWQRMHGLIDVQGAAMGQRDQTQTAQATWRNTSAVFSVAFSPDGTHIVSGCSDGTIRIRDVYSGNITVGPLLGHTLSVKSVRFSPDANLIASCSKDLTIRVWDAHTGDVIAGPFMGHTHSVNALGFSPDGKRIASGSKDRTIRVWDTHTGDTISGPFEGHTNWINSIAFSPDGARIASGSNDKTVRVICVTLGNLAFGPLLGHTGFVTSVAFTPDGAIIVSGSRDKTIRTWDALTGSSIAGPFTGHLSSVTSVSFSPDGSRIVSGSNDRTVRVWDTGTGKGVAKPMKGHEDHVNVAAFSPDGLCIISGSSDHTVRLWDTITVNTVDVTSKGHNGAVSAVAFAPDGTCIVSGSYDRTIRVWNAWTGDCITQPFNGHESCIESVAFSPDSTRVVSGSRDKTIRVWDIRTGDMVAGPFRGHTGWVSSVAFSPNGTCVASGSRDQTVRLWDAHTGNSLDRLYTQHSSFVESVAFSPDGTRIASGSNDQSTRVWDAATCDTVAGPFKGHTDGARSVAFSANGAYIASCSSYAVQVWDSHTCDTIVGPLKHPSPVNSVAFSPVRDHIVSCSYDRTVRVWDAHTGEIIAGPFKEHIGRVNSVAFSPGGMRIASGSDDYAIRVLRPYAVPPIPAALPPTNLIQQNLVDGVLMNIKDSKGKDGWIVADEVPLFWVPLDFRAHLPFPQNLFVIGPQGSVVIDYQGLVLGDRWSECYVPQSL